MKPNPGETFEDWCKRPDVYRWIQSLPTGGGNCTLRAASDAMGIDWMTKAEINEAIPPAYTEFLGRAALAHIASLRKAA